MTTTLRFPPRLDVWSDLRRELVDGLQRARVPLDVVDDIVLITEELFVNAVTHGKGASGGPPIEIHVEAEDGLLTLRFEAVGPSFDSCLVPSTDLDLPDRERPIGGLGLHLLRRLTDRMDYRRAGDRNILTLQRSYSP